MLRACRRLLRPSGRIAYFTITVAPDLPAARHRRAVRDGPRAVASTRPQDELLRRAGFVDVSETDATDEYLRTSEALVVENERHLEQLRAPDPATFDQRLTDQRAMVVALREGLLRRSLLVGSRPEDPAPVRRRSRARPRR